MRSSTYRYIQAMLYRYSTALSSRKGVIRPLVVLVGFVVLLSSEYSIREIQPSRLTVGVPVSEQQNVRVTSANTGSDIHANVSNPTANALLESMASVQIDILSIGSHTRPSYHEAQQATFGSYSMVRNFVKVTEEVDSDTTCPDQLGWSALSQIVLFCRGHFPHQIQSRRPFNTSFAREQHKRFVPLHKLLQKKNPVGWLCAQKRPMEGFVSYMQRYLPVRQHPSSPSRMNSTDSVESDQTRPVPDFPDYLFIVDDDTYVNLPLVMSELVSRFPSHDAHAVSGRLLGSHKYFTYPVGGLGVMLSRRVLQNFVTPVHCHSERARSMDTTVPHDFEAHVCEQIPNNLIGEANLFQEGMTLLDLVRAYTTRYRYTDFQRWSSPGYCMHSDWVWGYFFRTYPLAHESGLRPYNAASPLTGEAHSKSPYDATMHDHTKSQCTVQSHLCHYAGPEQMRVLFHQSLQSEGKSDLL